MPEFLSLLSGGVIGGFVGAFLGGFAKFFWENWLPSQLTWRRQQKVEREKLLSQYRDPAMRATSELQDRIYAVLMTSSLEYLIEIDRQDYYVTSTAFLVAQFFAWVEILRRKAALLDYQELTTLLNEVGHAFSHGRGDFQIFNLEQREIGERMIVSSLDQQNDYHSLGYAAFLDLIRKDSTPVCISQLEVQVRQMLGGDLPSARLVQIQHALIDTMDFLDPLARWVPTDKRTKVAVG
jgi:hypothetical protein